MIKQSRRQFLKFASYGSLLAISHGLSGLSMAQSPIDLSADKLGNQTEIVNLINHTASAVTLRDTYTANSDRASAVIAPVVIAPGEQHSFIVTKAVSKDDARSANSKNVFITDVLENQLEINSDHVGFNGLIETSVFQTQVS